MLADPVLQLLVVLVSSQKTWLSRTTPGRGGTRRWPSASEQTTRWCTGATSSDTKTQCMSTRTVNFTENATFTEPWTSYSATPRWCSKTAPSGPESPWPNRRTPSRPKTERTRIRTRAFRSTIVGSWPRRILKHPRVATPLIWDVLGNFTLEPSSCCPT